MAEKSLVAASAAELEFLQREFVKGPVLVECDKHKNYAHFGENGEVKFRRGEPPIKDHLCNDIDSVVRIAKDLLNGSAKIWYSRYRIQCVNSTNFLDSPRNEFATLKLTPTKQYETIRQLDQNKTWIDQRALIRLLKFDLKDCVAGNADALIEIMSQVKFKADQDVTTGVQRGKASIGKQASAEVTGVGQIPEYITFTVPLVNEITSMVGGACLHSAPIECYLEIDEQNAKFRLLPLPGKIEDAMLSLEHLISVQLAELLGDDPKIPVYFGSHS